MTDNARTSKMLFVDDRSYLFEPMLVGDDAPVDERPQLLATVRRIWSHDTVIEQRSGELRSNSLKVQVMISGHKRLKHSQRGSQPVEQAFLVLDEPASYNVIADRVSLGSADIQTRNRHLKWNGLGTLMFNAMIAWCHQYHATSSIEPLLVTDHSETGPTKFYGKFGMIVKGNRTKEMLVSDLAFAPIASRLKPIKRGMIPDYMLPGEWPALMAID